MRKFFKDRLKDFLWYIGTTYVPVVFIIIFIIVAANYWPEHIWGSTVGFIVFTIIVVVTIIWKKG